MSSSQFRIYKPGEHQYATRRATEEWDIHRTFLTNLHRQGLSRKIMRAALAERGFEVSTGQLTKKMMDWGLKPRGAAKCSQADLLENCFERGIVPEVSARNSSSYVSSRQHDDDDDVGYVEGYNKALPRERMYGDYQMNWEDLPISQAHSSRRSSTPMTSASSIWSGGNTSGRNNTPPSSMDSGSKRSLTDASSSFSSACFQTNLRNLKERSKILKKLQAVEISGKSLPLPQCCCADFFERKGSFRSWRVLYDMLYEAGSNTDSLKYAIAVIRMREDGTQQRSIDQVLQSTLDAYIRLLNRPRTRNNLAYAIAMQLARRHDWRNHHRKYGADEDSQTTRVLRCDARYHGCKLRPYISLNDFDLLDEQNTYNEEPFTHFLERTQRGSMPLSVVMLEDCRQVLLSCIGTVSNTINGKMMCSSYPKGSGHLSSRNSSFHTLLEIAAEISMLLAANAHRICLVRDNPLGSTRGSKMLDAVALMVTQAIWNTESSIPPLTREDMIQSINSTLGCLDTTYQGPSVQDVHLRFLQACWVCDPDQVIFGSQGLHLGLCRAGRVWIVLESNIRDHDEPLPRSDPSLKTRTAADNADAAGLSYSRRASESNMSDSRLVDALSSRMSSTRISSGSSWSGHMSHASWRLESTLETPMDNEETFY